MKSLVQVLKSRVQSEKKYFVNPQKYAQTIKNLAQKELASPRIFLFGSVVENKATPGSDIDLLVVSPSVPQRQSDRAKIKAAFYKEIGFYSPFEIHLITPQELDWYARFINRKIEV